MAISDIGLSGLFRVWITWMPNNPVNLDNLDAGYQLEAYVPIRPFLELRPPDTDQHCLEYLQQYTVCPRCIVQMLTIYKRKDYLERLNHAVCP